MTFHDHIDIVRRLARIDAEAALDTAWRFATAEAGEGWRRSVSSAAACYTYVARLVHLVDDAESLYMVSRQDKAQRFQPILCSELVCAAKRRHIELLLMMTFALFGRIAATHQKIELAVDYPLICRLRKCEIDALAHSGRMPLVRLATISGMSACHLPPRSK